MNDLWNYSVHTNEWTLMNGSITSNNSGNYGSRLFSSPTNLPPCRMGSIGWTDTLGNLWLFGGMYGFSYYNDMWKFVPDSTCPLISPYDTVTSAFIALPISGCDSITITFNNTSTRSE